MSDEVLRKIFSSASGVAIDGLVTAKKTAGIWIVTDRIGRTMTGRSTETWRPGVDWVTVQDGRIVGRAVRRGKIKVYKV